MKSFNDIPSTWYPALIIAIWATTIAPFLGLVPLFDYDETIYAQTALDMMQQGEWIVPTANGMQFFEKPPFTYYMMDLCYSLFGVNAFSARLPSAIFTLLTALLLFRFGKAYRSDHFGLITALIFLSMFEVGLLARAAILDAVLNFFIAATLLFYFRWLQTNSRRHAYWCSLLMGAAVSIKGPVGAVVPVLVILADRLIARNLMETLRNIPWLPAIGLFLLAATPWYLMIFIQHGPAFLYEFIVVHNLGRAMNPMQGHGGGWHYYLVVFAVSVLPWLTWIPLAFQRFLQALRTENSDQGNTSPTALMQICWLWIVLVIILFTFAQTKLPHYISCIYPAVAIILAIVIEQHRPSFENTKALRWLSVLILLPIAGALIAFPFVYEQLTSLVHHPRAVAVLSQPVQPSASITVGGFILMAALGLLFYRRLSLPRSFILIGFALQLSLLLPLAGFAGKLAQGPQQSIASAIQKLPEDIPVYSYNLNFPSISFYAQRNYRIALNANGQAEIQQATSPRALIMRLESLGDFPELHLQNAVINQGGFLLFVIDDDKPTESNH